MKQVQKSSLISGILSNKVWSYNIKCFLSYSKKYMCYFMQFNWWHKYSTFICPFEFGNCGKEAKKIYKNLNIYVENENKF